MAGLVLPLVSCVADPAPVIGTAVAGDGRAMVSWETPVSDNGATIAEYVVIPYVGSVARPPVRFASAATHQILTGLANGTTYAFVVFGINELGAETARSGRSNAVTPTAVPLAGGGAHTCAMSSGAVTCWGDNSSGQLGNGLLGGSSSPVSVSGISTAVAITSGYAHACVLLSTGAVKCWGENSSGQLGNGSTTDRRTPVSVSGLTGALAIAAGGNHTCAVVTGGAVKCWGSNYRGQLGSGTTTDASSPVTVPGLTGIVEVTASLGHTCALASTGGIACWGANYSGALGNGTIIGSALPVPVSGIDDAVDVAAGGSASESLHTCAVIANGSTMCWGNDGYGQLGNATTTNSPTPVPVPVIGGSGMLAVAAGDVHTCATMIDGAITCWGNNVSGQLGDGGSGIGAHSTVPISVVGLQGGSASTAGDHHSCAALTDGSVQCWGNNESGQLGDGTTTSSPTPVTVIGT